MERNFAERTTATHLPSLTSEPRRTAGAIGYLWTGCCELLASAGPLDSRRGLTRGRPFAFQRRRRDEERQTETPNEGQSQHPHVVEYMLQQIPLLN